MKKRKRINIKKFGAVMDGKTDDTAAVQAALDEAIRTGGVVVIPSGTTFVRSLDARGVSLVGAGVASTKVRMR